MNETWIEAPADVVSLGITKGDRINVLRVVNLVEEARVPCPHCDNPAVTQIREAEHCRSGRALTLFSCAACAGVVYVAAEHAALDDEWEAVA